MRSSTHTMTPPVLAVLGGLIFLSVFALRYSFTDDFLYAVRDDGVITMSVARNLIDYGFIGVSPSGPIVEASSSPLQTLVYAMVYGVTGADYASFSLYQTYVASALIGALFILFFADVPRRAVIATALTAGLLTVLFPFFLWHGSGMENALTHLAFLAALYAVFSMDREGRIRWPWVAVFLSASLARVDSVVLVFILLATFSSYWLVQYRRLDAFWFSVAVGMCWVAVQIGRYLYFGDLLPNTAYAQKISVSDRLGAVASGDIEAIKNVVWIWAALIIKHGWWLVILAVPFLKGLRLTPGTRAVVICLVVLGVTSFVTPLLFGRARIDVTRTTTHLTLLFMLALAIVLVRSDLWDRFTTGMRTGLLAAMAALAFAGALIVGPGPYYLGWHTSEMLSVRETFEEIGTANDLPRPLVANHDLGVLSWAKSLNVLDVGQLGSPVIAKLPTVEDRGNYMLDFVQPDLIAMQFVWSEQYCDGFFRDPRFDALYVNLEDAAVSGTEYCAVESPPRAFWIRRAVQSGSVTAERLLIDRLLGGLTAAPFREALDGCDAGVDECRWVMRTAYRFMPELRAQGLADEVTDLFSNEAERAYLSSWRSAKAHEVLVALYASAPAVE